MGGFVVAPVTVRGRDLRALAAIVSEDCRVSVLNRGAIDPAFARGPS